MVKKTKRNAQLKRWVQGVLLASGLYIGSGSLAMAASMEITAVFRPDPANPMVNKFINTTTPSGFCIPSNQAWCDRYGLFSVRTPLTFIAKGPIKPNNEERYGAMFKVPAQWRSLQVTHSRTGEQAMLEFRIAAIGGWHELGNTVSYLTGGGTHGTLWVGGMWHGNASPCLSTPNQTISGTGQSFFWRVPEGDGACVKQARFVVPELRYTSFHLAYELRTPNPLAMSSGEYTGNLLYTVGPGSDFDMGDLMVANDSVLNFDFRLNVEHTLKVEVPPGGHRVELIPQGGWQAWLNQGRKPVRLFRDQTFNVSSSSRFKMQLECQYPVGNTCALRDTESADLVPLNTSVSLPSGLTDGSGQAVHHRPLRLDGSGTEMFQPGYYVDRKPGTLHFEVTKEHVETILREGVGKTYSGNVTVIWDSELI